jgi:uncharacterized protein YbjT (DUF2867 family)
VITVTAATGHYGRLVIEELLKRGVPADDIMAAVRTPQKAADLAERGVQVRDADYDRPETLVPAFAGIDRLLIPSGGYGQRYPQMQRAVKAAAEAKVGLIAYPGFVNSDTSTLRLGEEHKQTEALIRASGLPFVLLRNGAYTEMYTDTLGPALQYGAILGSAGDGKVAGATRADLAKAAAVVLTGDGHEGKVYELGGPRSPWPTWPPRCPSRPASTSSTTTCRSSSTPRRWPPRACPRRWPTSWPTPASRSLTATGTATAPTCTSSSAGRPPPWPRRWPSRSGRRTDRHPAARTGRLTSSTGLRRRSKTRKDRT